MTSPRTCVATRAKGWDPVQGSKGFSWRLASRFRSWGPWARPSRRWSPWRGSLTARGLRARSCEVGLMKIVLFHPTRLPPRDYGGVERVVLWLAQGLIERGHEVWVAAHPGSE